MKTSMLYDYTMNLYVFSATYFMLVFVFRCFDFIWKSVGHDNRWPSVVEIF